MDERKQIEQELIQFSIRSNLSTSRRSKKLAVIIEEDEEEHTEELESTNRRSVSAVSESKQPSTEELLPIIDECLKLPVDVLNKNVDNLNTEKEIEQEKEFKKVSEGGFQMQKETETQRLLNQQPDQKTNAENRPQTAHKNIITTKCTPLLRIQLPSLPGAPRLNLNRITPALPQVQPEYKIIDVKPKAKELLTPKAKSEDEKMQKHEKFKSTITESENQDRIKSQKQKTSMRDKRPYLNQIPGFPTRKLAFIDLSDSDENHSSDENEETSPEYIKLQKEVALVEARLEFLKNNPDYIPESMDFDPATVLLTQTEILTKPLKKTNKFEDVLENQKQSTNLSHVKVDTEKPLEVDSQIEELNAHQMVIAENALSEDYGEEVELLKKIDEREFLDPRTLKQFLEFKESKNRVAKAKEQLELLTNSRVIASQPEVAPQIVPEVNANVITASEEPPVIEQKNPEIESTENTINDIKSKLELLQNRQNETYEEYLERVKIEMQNKFKGIDDDKTNLSEITDKKQDAEEIEKDYEKSEEVVEEVIEEVIEEAEEEQENETDNGNDEEWEDGKSEDSQVPSAKLPVLKTVTEDKKLIGEVVKPKGEIVEAPQRRKLIDILKRMNWITSVNPDNYEPAPEKSDDEEQSEEIRLSESTQYDDILETLELEEHSTSEKTENVLSLTLENCDTVDSQRTLQESLLESTSQKDVNPLNKNNIAVSAETKHFAFKKTENILPQTSEDCKTIESQKEVIKPPTLQESLLDNKLTNDQSVSSFLESKTLPKPKPQKYEKPLTETLSTKSLKKQDKLKSKNQANLKCRQREQVDTVNTSERKTECKDLKRHSDGKESQLKLIYGSSLPRKRQSTKIQPTLDKSIKRFSSTIRCNTENKEDLGSSLKRQPSSLKCNVDKRTYRSKVVSEIPKCEVINVAPCIQNFKRTGTGKTKIKCKEVKYSDDFESESDNPVQRADPKVEYTEVQRFHSDSFSDATKSIKLESVQLSYPKSDGTKDSFNCHLYRLKLRVKAITWQTQEKTGSVTLRFYNPYTKEIATVDRRFVVPYFYTADIYCYVPYICLPEMIETCLLHYAPRIYIYKRKSDEELAEGTLSLKKSQLELKESFTTIVPMLSKGKKLAEALVCLRLFDAGPILESDEKANGVIQLILKETKNKPYESEVVKSQKRSKISKCFKSIHITEKDNTGREVHSSSDNCSFSEVPHSKVFKENSFLYKREKSEASETKLIPHDESFVTTSSISVQTEFINQPKTLINNCNDIQTDVLQEEQVDTEKLKIPLVQSKIESSSISVAESKLTQTETITKKSEATNSCKDEQSKNKAKTISPKQVLTTTSASNEKNLINIVQPLAQTEKVEVKRTDQKGSIKVKVEESSKMGIQVTVKSAQEELHELEDKNQLLIYRVETEKGIKTDSVKTEEVKIKKQKNKLKLAPKKIDVRMSQVRAIDMESDSSDFLEQTIIEQTSRTVHQNLQAEKLAEQFFRVCVESKLPPFDKITRAELEKFKENYVRRLRANLPSDCEAPPSITSTQTDESEKQWLSHMEAFLHKKKRGNDESSSSTDNTENQISELKSEEATHDVLINNPDYHAERKFYNPELCKADVTTSTAYPLICPPTAEASIQAIPKVIKTFTAQTKESKPVVKSLVLHPCLIIVDTIPCARNSYEKFVNKNILYEKIIADDMSQQDEIEDTTQPMANALYKIVRAHDMQDEDEQDKITPPKALKEAEYPLEIIDIKQPQDLNFAQNLLLEKAFFQPSCESTQEKETTKDLHGELQDFLKNISLEVHYLKHRAQNLQMDGDGDDILDSPINTDFDKVLKNFQLLKANNEKQDFRVVFREVQQLQNLVYNTFKKFSQRYLDKLETRSRGKNGKNVYNYESQDKELKLIFENPKMCNKQTKKNVREGTHTTHSLPNMKSEVVLQNNLNDSSSESSETVIITKHRNQRMSSKKSQSGYKSKETKSSLSPIDQESSSSSLSILHSGRPIEIEKIQMEAIKEKMSEVQLKLRNYMQDRELHNKNNGETCIDVTRMTKNIKKLLHEWRRLKSYVEQVCEA